MRLPHRFGLGTARVAVSGRGGGRPRRSGPRKRESVLEALEPRCLLTTIAPYPLPKVSGSVSFPAEITLAGGKLWATSGSVGGLWMVDPSAAGGPSTVHYGAGFSSVPVGLTTGPDGNVWFAETSAGDIGMLSPGNPAQVHNYNLAAGAAPESVTSGVDHNGNPVIWYTDPGNTSAPRNKLGAISMAGVAAPEVTLPNTFVGIASFVGFTSQIVSDANGKLWFTEVNFNNTTQVLTGGIGSYDPVSQTWSEIVLPTGHEPFGITVGPDGNIWFGDAVPVIGGAGFQSASLAMIDPDSPSAIAATYTVPKTAGGGVRLPYRLAAGPDGNLWFTDNAFGAVGSFNLTTHAFSMTDVPKGTSFDPIPIGIAAGPDGNLWVADNSGAVDRVTPTLELVAQAPSNVAAGIPFALTVGVRYADTNVVNQAFSGTVAAALQGNGTLSGGGGVSFANGTATFPNLIVSAGGTGDTITLTAPGAIPFTTSPFNVSNAILKVWNQTTGTIAPGGVIGVQVVVTTVWGSLNSSYNGNVTLQLAGGSTGGGVAPMTVAASGGVATFGLVLNNPGTYIFTASGAGLNSATTAPVVVVAPAPPVVRVVSAAALVTQRRNRRGRPSGRPTLSGYEFTFNAPMAGSVANPANFVVQAYVRVRTRVGRRVVNQLQLRPVGFSLSYSAATNTVQLLTGRQTFAQGGQITLSGTGLTSAQGGAFDGNGDGTGGDSANYAIGARGTSIRYSG